MRKILYVSGTRADYGLMKAVLAKIDKEFDLEIAACGMHLMPDFGHTVDEIKKDGFKLRIIDAHYTHDEPDAAAQFLGEFIKKFTVSIKRNKPDIILVLGDRAEMLAAAIVGAYLMIPVAHIHGGDVTSTVDEISRHAITKLAHIHFAVTQKSARRLIKMGEEPWRVHLVGAPGLDSILHERILGRYQIACKYHLDLRKPVLLVVQHPVSLDFRKSKTYVKQTLEAIKELGCQSIIIYPNADAGGRRIIKVIEEYGKYPFIRIYPHLNRIDYLSLMKIATALVGNSSSGIIEAPSLKLATVNIGDRQAGRESASNIINVGYDKEQIKKAITKAINDRRFKNILKSCRSPYGDGRAGEKISRVLRCVPINKILLQKKLNY